MKVRIAMGAVAALLATGALTAADLKSGPQVGGRVSAFHPLHVTGSMAGKKFCLVWQYGPSPVAVVFARETSDGLTSLVKKIEAATTERKGLKSFVVFLNDEDGLENKLKDLAAKEGLKNTILTVDNPTGPPAYKIAKDADVTVVYYLKHSVKANHAFKKGELKDAGVEAAVQDLDKIAPKK